MGKKIIEIVSPATQIIYKKIIMFNRSMIVIIIIKFKILTLIKSSKIIRENLLLREDLLY